MSETGQAGSHSPGFALFVATSAVGLRDRRHRTVSLQLLLHLRAADRAARDGARPWHRKPREWNVAVLPSWTLQLLLVGGHGSGSRGLPPRRIAEGGRADRGAPCAAPDRNSSHRRRDRDGRQDRGARATRRDDPRILAARLSSFACAQPHPSQRPTASRRAGSVLACVRRPRGHRENTCAAPVSISCCQRPFCRWATART